MKKALAAFALSICVTSTICAQRHKSDREDDGLKGQVKVVLVESAKLTNESGKWVEGGRVTADKRTYDAEGNLIEKNEYNYLGTLVATDTYSYIDGDQTVKHNILLRQAPGFVVLEDSAKGEKPKPSDPRYTWKYKYKYDDNGNRTEMTIYQNDGSMWMRYVYNLKGNQKETLAYSADGSLNQREVETLDDRGNPVEVSYFDTKTNSVRSKSSYTYEFDTKGNWIKRVTLNWVTNEGKSRYEPKRVHYQTITYF